MKKKVLAIALAAILAITAITGATLAYFTDTDEIDNTFTAGNVAIDLTEQDPNNAEKRVDVGEEETEEVKFPQLFPGMTLTKDPTIENVGSLEAYVAAKIEINRTVGYELLSGGLLAKQEGYKLIVEEDAEKDTVTIYIFIEKALQPEESVVLFDTLTIPTAWDNAEMAIVNGLHIHVEAYATQVYGFTDCYEAITTAFAEEFAFEPAA